MNKPPRPRQRVWIDNDFSGDPDDLFQLAHHLLCDSAEVRGITGSHLAPGDFLDGSDQSARNAVRMAEDLLTVMGRSVPVYPGSPTAWEGALTPKESPAVRAFLEEALSPDPRPLFVACGAGLTDVASAVALCPGVAGRFTLVWIGGAEHPDLAEPPPGVRGLEYNLNIDLKAAQFLFNQTTVPIWQVPRDAYRQCLVSLAELDHRIGGCRLGRHLIGSLDRVFAAMDDRGWPRGETYALGDQPLVLLTALQSFFDPFPASCRSVVRDTPVLRDDGTYGPGSGSRPLRIFTHLDTRLMFEDLYARVNQAPGH